MLLGGIGVAAVIGAGAFAYTQVMRASNPVQSTIAELGQFSTGINAAGDGIGEGIAGAGTGIAGLGIGLGEGLAGVGDIGTGAGNLLSSTGQGIQGILQGSIDTVSEVLTGPGRLVNSVVSGIGQGISNLWSNRQKKQDEYWDTVQTARAERSACWKRNENKGWFWKVANCGV